MILVIFSTNKSFKYYFLLQKTVAAGSGVPLVTRDAILHCRAGYIDSNGITAKVYCCRGDRCNIGIALSNSLSLVIITIAINAIFRAPIIG
jgi:hypothetical protein